MRAKNTTKKSRTVVFFAWWKNKRENFAREKISRSNQKPDGVKRDKEMKAEAHKRGKHKETENTQRIEIGNKSEGKCCTRQQ